MVLLCYICILPESPRWLLAVNRTTQAVELLENMAKINNLPVNIIAPQIELYQLEHRSHVEKKGYVWDLFRTPNLRKNVLIMSFMWLVCSYYFYGVSYYICHLTGNLKYSLGKDGNSDYQSRSVAMAMGLLLCTAWYYTILAGFFTLYCPALYLMFFNHKLYRKVTDLLFALWELYPVALFQCCFNTHLHHFGDYVNPHESTIVILNHRTRVDWNYIWIALYHATQEALKEKCSCKEQREEISDIFDVGGKAKIKFVLKDELKVVPGLGWIMQLNFFLYVKRAWREDQLSLTQFADYYERLKYPCRLVLFPEGTDLSEDNRMKSHKFADANKLPHYQYVLHPRTTGWAALVSRMRGAGLASVYDVTLAYDTPAQTEADLLRGKTPRHVYVHVKRYSIQQLPSDEDALRSWINNRWMDKESSLRKFYLDGTFIDPTSNRAPPERDPREFFTAKLGFLFWTSNIIRL
ncbi:acyltransferase domain-containing protein [Phthorimaea operculella]|nr:acyltransferase domain-containing protein [Phthorimaea operculella]